LTNAALHICVTFQVDANSHIDNRFFNVQFSQFGPRWVFGMSKALLCQLHAYNYNPQNEITNA